MTDPAVMPPATLAPNQTAERPETTATYKPADAPGGIPTCLRKLPQRKNLRAEFHDYSGGDYFVTICTRDKNHYFGRIVGTHGSCVRNTAQMKLTTIGKYCQEQLELLATHYPYAVIPLYVVMSNHIHAIIHIDSPQSHDDLRTHEPCVPTCRTALSVIVGGFKRAFTMFARRNNIEFGWQSRYHDHIIRGVNDGNMIAEYIENNIARWADDCFYGN